VVELVWLDYAWLIREVTWDRRQWSFLDHHLLTFVPSLCILTIIFSWQDVTKSPFFMSFCMKVRFESSKNWRRKLALIAITVGSTKTLILAASSNKRVFVMNSCRPTNGHFNLTYLCVYVAVPAVAPYHTYVHHPYHRVRSRYLIPDPDTRPID